MYLFNLFVLCLACFLFFIFWFSVCKIRKIRKIVMKFLIQEYFEPINVERLAEIRHVLDLNIKNKNIDFIYLLNEHSHEYINSLNSTKVKQIITNKRLTYKMAFDYCSESNGFTNDDIIILANNDISFVNNISDKSFENIDDVFKDNSNTVIALSRSEENADGTGTGTDTDNLETFTCSSSQDVWIYKGFMKNGSEENEDFYFGIPGCDNRIAYILSKKGYKLRNLPFDIITIHHHKSNFRTITKEDVVTGQYKNIPIEKIKSITHVGSYTIIEYIRHLY